MYKVMALDVGTKRIGIALSDFLLMLANGHSYIPREPEDKAIEAIYKIAKENRVEKIVVGVPLKRTSLLNSVFSSSLKLVIFIS